LTALSDNRPVHSVPNVKRYWYQVVLGKSNLGEIAWLGGHYMSFSDRISDFLFLQHHTTEWLLLILKLPVRGNVTISLINNQIR